MGDTGHGPKRQNPYAVPEDSQATGSTDTRQPAQTSPQRPSQPRQPAQFGGPPAPRPALDPDQVALLRRARRVTLLGALAAVAAVLLPPLGFIGGIVAIVLGARLVSPLRVKGVTLVGAVLPISSGAFALVVGGLLTALLVIAAPELRDFRDCMSGANTRLAEEACQEEFTQRISDRFLSD